MKKMNEKDRFIEFHAKAAHKAFAKCPPCSSEKWSDLLESDKEVWRQVVKGVFRAFMSNENIFYVTKRP